MTDWKMVKHGERGVGLVELSASERVVRACFESYAPRDKKNYAELFLPDGDLVDRKPKGKWQ